MSTSLAVTLKNTMILRLWGSSVLIANSNALYMLLPETSLFIETVFCSLGEENEFLKRRLNSFASLTFYHRRGQLAANYVIRCMGRPLNATTTFVWAKLAVPNHLQQQ